MDKIVIEGGKKKLGDFSLRGENKKSKHVFILIKLKSPKSIYIFDNESKNMKTQS